MTGKRKSIVEGMREEMAELMQDRNLLAKFVGAYNGKKGSRTALMVKGSGVYETREQDCGFVPRAMQRSWLELFNGELFGNNKKPNPHYERYVDIRIQSPGWWAGEEVWEWIVEVENRWKELKGTISDLLRVQARRKLGIFYHRRLNQGQGDTAGVAKEVCEAIGVAFGSFQDQGFREADETYYEIIVLPEVCSVAGLIGCNAVALAFEHGQWKSRLDLTGNLVVTL